MRFYFTLVIFFLISTKHLYSHELWIENINQTGQNISSYEAHMFIGENLIGESYPFINEETEQYFLITKNGKIELKQNDGDFPAFQQKFTDNNWRYIYYQSKPEIVEYENIDLFKTFIDEYDLPIDQLPKKAPKETYIRLAKNIHAFKNHKYFKNKLNLEFEIMNENNVLTEPSAKIRVFLDKKPFKNRTIKVFFKNNNSNIQTKYKTDRNGSIQLDIRKKGFYLISAVDLKKIKPSKNNNHSDYYSRWASLSFVKH